VPPIPWAGSTPPPGATLVRTPAPRARLRNRANVINSERLSSEPELPYASCAVVCLCHMWWRVVELGAQHRAFIRGWVFRGCGKGRRV